MFKITFDGDIGSVSFIFPRSRVDRRETSTANFSGKTENFCDFLITWLKKLVYLIPKCRSSSSSRFGIQRTKLVSPWNRSPFLLAIWKRSKNELISKSKKIAAHANVLEKLKKRRNFWEKKLTRLSRITSQLGTPKISDFFWAFSYQTAGHPNFYRNRRWGFLEIAF